jgi:hypothetical protein
MDLFAGEESLTLRISMAEESVMASLVLNSAETTGFITAFVNFDITPIHISAQLVLEAPALETDLIDMPLSNPISGEGVIRFGDGERREEHKQDVKSPVLDETGNPSGAAILNELALSFAREEFIMEDPESPENTSGEPSEGASIQVSAAPSIKSAEEPDADLGGAKGEAEIPAQ